MATAPAARVSYDEYLAFERATEGKHQFEDGVVYAMLGGTADHATVAGDVFGELRTPLRGKGCAAFNSDLRTRTADDTGTYPDVSVVCGERRYTDAKHDEIRNPIVIVEVLSPSTEAYDRGKKFAHYRTIESLRDYVLVSTSEKRVEVFSRQADGAWLLRSWTTGETAVIGSIEQSFAVDVLYENAEMVTTGL